MSPANRQNRTLLYLLIIILLIFNLGLFYLWQKGKEERELANKQNTELEAELQRKANAIAAAESLLAQYQQDSATMAENNQQMSDELGMKWVGTPIAFRPDMKNSDRRLFNTPLPSIVARFSALKAVASSLKYCTNVPGSGPSYRIFALPS